MAVTETRRVYPPKSAKLKLQYLQLLRLWNRHQFAWRFELMDVAEAVLRKHRAPSSARDLYMVLLRSRLRIGPRIRCTRSALGSAIGRHDRTVQRALQWLLDKGLIAIRRENGSENLEAIATPYRRLRFVLGMPQEPKKRRKAPCLKLSTVSPIHSPGETLLAPPHPLAGTTEYRPATADRKKDLGISRNPLLLKSDPPGPNETATAPRRATPLPQLPPDEAGSGGQVHKPPG